MSATSRREKSQDTKMLIEMLVQKEWAGQRSAWRRRTLHKAKHVAACTAADAVAELAARPRASAVVRRLLAAVSFG